MSDPLVLFLNKNQRTSYIHKSVISEQDIKKSQFSTKNENKRGRLPALLVNFLFLLRFWTPYWLLRGCRCYTFGSFLFQPRLSVKRKNILRLLTYFFYFLFFIFIFALFQEVTRTSTLDYKAKIH